MHHIYFNQPNLFIFRACPIEWFLRSNILKEVSAQLIQFFPPHVLIILSRQRCSNIESLHTTTTMLLSHTRGSILLLQCTLDLWSIMGSRADDIDVSDSPMTEKLLIWPITLYPRCNCQENRNDSLNPLAERTGLDFESIQFSNTI